MKHKCSVCNLPIKNRGIHDACKLTGQGSGRTRDGLLIAAAKYQAAAGKRLEQNIKHWNYKMGRKKLIEMFPDMIDRPQKRD